MGRPLRGGIRVRRWYQANMVRQQMPITAAITANTTPSGTSAENPTLPNSPLTIAAMVNAGLSTNAHRAISGWSRNASEMANASDSDSNEPQDDHADRDAFAPRERRDQQADGSKVEGDQRPRRRRCGRDRQGCRASRRAAPPTATVSQPEHDDRHKRDGQRQNARSPATWPPRMTFGQSAARSRAATSGRAGRWRPSPARSMATKMPTRRKIAAKS